MRLSYSATRADGAAEATVILHMREHHHQFAPDDHHVTRFHPGLTARGLEPGRLPALCA